MTGWIVVAAACVFVLLAAIAADAQTTGDRSCDDKEAAFHVKRARAIIRSGHAESRYPDETPMKAEEKRALKGHKLCLLAPDLRERVAEYRERTKARYLRGMRGWLYEGLINPPGTGYLAGLRACESGGDYYVDSTYDGAYQFDQSTWASTASVFSSSGYPEPTAPTVLSASPAQQDIRAAILYRARGSSPWPVCG